MDAIIIIFMIFQLGISMVTLILVFLTSLVVVRLQDRRVEPKERSWQGW